jgi:serine/threonine protein kinase
MSTELLARIAEKCTEFEGLLSRGVAVDLDAFVQDVDECNRERVRIELEELAAELGYSSEKYQGVGGGLGTEVERYELKENLQCGGMGQVWIAVDTQFGRRVALKEPLVGVKETVEKRNRFLHEAEITARLNHPGIVPIYSKGHHRDGTPYYTMRLISGEDSGTLLDLINEHHGKSFASSWEAQHSMDQLIERLIKVCSTIAYAHNQGVAHRDIKPANVLTGQFGETLVVDWGLAHTIQDSDGGHVQREFSRPKGDATAATLGTLGYSAPEQLCAGGGATAACDIYSLGAVLYHILTGRPAYSRDRFSSLDDLVKAVSTGDFPAPRAVRRSIPGGLEAICLKAMAVDPEDRYSTASDFATDLQFFIEDLPITASPDTSISSVTRWFRHHRTAFYSLLATIFVALTALLIIGGRQSMHNIALEAKQLELEDEIDLKQRAITESERLNRRSIARESLAIDALAAFPEVLLDDDALKYAETPEAQQFRKLFLSKALEFYQRTLYDIDTETELADVNRDKLVGMNQAIGHLCRELGDYAQSIECLQEVSSLLRPMMPPLAPRDGKKEWWITDKQAINAARFVGNTNALMTTLQAAGDYTNALKEYQEAKPWVPLLETLSKENEKVKLTLMELQRNHAILLALSKQNDQAREAFTKAIEYSEEQIEEGEECESINRNLSRIKLDYSVFLLGIGLTSEGVSIIDETIRKIEGQADGIESMDSYQLSILGNAYNNRANSVNGDLWINDFAEWSNKALLVYREMVKRDPKNRMILSSLRYSLCSTADAEMRRGNSLKAWELVSEASELVSKLHSQNSEDEKIARDFASTLHQKGLIAMNMNKRDEAVSAFERAYPLLVKRFESMQEEMFGAGGDQAVDAEKQRENESWTRRMMEASVLVGEQAILKANLPFADQVYSRCQDVISRIQPDFKSTTPVKEWIAPFVKPVTSGYTLVLDAFGRSSQSDFWVGRFRTKKMEMAVGELERRSKECETIPINELVSLGMESDSLHCHGLSYTFFQEAFRRTDLPADAMLPPVVATAVQQALRASLRDKDNAEKHRKVAFDWLHAHVLRWPIRPEDPDTLYRDVLEYWGREPLLAWTRMENGPLKLNAAEFEAWAAFWRGLRRRYSVQ